MRLAVALLCSGFLVAPVSAQERDIFKEKGCSACHAIGPGAGTKVGPHLNGIVGRPVGGLDDYNYSSALAAAEAKGQVWTRELLKLYLKKPAHLFPGTTMNYAGIARRADIEELIDYLKGFPAEGAANSP
jgi:cytochrome c